MDMNIVGKHKHLDHLPRPTMLLAAAAAAAAAAATSLLAIAPAAYGAIHETRTSSGVSLKNENAIRRLETNPNCKEHEIDFVLVEGDQLRTSIEGEIVDMLSKVGIKVNTRAMSKEDFNKAEQAGDFHLSFSETWGAPYDPHAYAKGWVAQDEGHFQALTNLESPNTKDSLFAEIEDVLREEDRLEQQRQWESIFTVVHDNAVMLPLWGARIPTVVNKRITNYVAGNQQFDYPVNQLKVISGAKEVTIAPGAQTGLFQSVGRLDPHTYRPNEFFANNWVYEGLVSYGRDGQILPALSSGWTITDKDNGQEYVFTIANGVTFHDGADWNCSVAKLNFDHVLAGGLRTPDWHGWYGLMDQIDSWDCNDDGDFVVTTKDKYYPFLQELSFIRPLRMLSPDSFANGISTDPYTSNSCHKGWGIITSDGEKNVTCAGITGPSGTGPFKFVSRTPLELDEDTTVDEEVVFEAFEDYWGGAPDIDTLKVVRYEDSDAVKTALEEGTLDIAWGSGVLSPDHINEIAASMDNGLSVYHSDDIQNVIVLLNSGKPPLDDIQVRKTIIHTINKKKLIEDNLGGLFKPVDNVFPRDAPFSDVDIFPRWDYDIEKAKLLNCPIAGEGDENIAELESQIDEAEKINEALEADKKTLITEKETLEAQQEALDKEKAELMVTKKKLEEEKKELELKVADSQAEIVDLKEDLEDFEAQSSGPGVASGYLHALVGSLVVAAAFMV